MKTNVKKKEREYSWVTFFAWLYLKTIGRILPERWNKWAENILHCDKTAENNETQADRPKAGKNVYPEVKKEDSETISEDEGIYSEGSTCSDTEVDNEDYSDIEDVWNGFCKTYKEDDEALEKQLNQVSEACIEIFDKHENCLKKASEKLKSISEELEEIGRLLARLNEHPSSNLNHTNSTTFIERQYS